MSHVHPPVPAEPDARPPELVLARYRLAERLGAGGMGVVHRARDEHLERDVAVKRIAIAGDLDGRAEREAIAAARLSHPGIVGLYEAGRDGDAVYLVSELVRGRTLAELLRGGELSDRDALRIGVTLCGALEHAHARGVIHRDVKPANVICPDRPEEGGGVAKLTDFGIARLADGDALTRTGDIMGTLAYMAPEQARGERITGAVDTYALGLVLYEALAGINPVRAGNAAATARRVGMRLAPLARLRRDLPRDLCRALDAAVVPDPRSRATLPQLREALARALPDVGDEPGAIAGSALEGLTSATRDRAQISRGWRQRPVAEPAWPAAPERVAAAPGAEDAGLPLAGRAAAGLAAGILAGAAMAYLGPEPPVAASGAGLAAGAAVALLPRAGWLLVAAALTGWLASAAAGLALVLAAAAAPVAPLLRREGATWSLPAVAPALGAAGLAGAWPALAGQASRWSTRAALGALGYWWLALTEALTSDQLVLGSTRDTLPRAAWESDALDALGDAIWPLLSSGALALAALWAVGAALLPVFVRGRSAATDVVGAAFWAAALATGTQAVAEALVSPTPRGLVIGAVLAGSAAVAARAVRGRA